MDARRGWYSRGYLPHFDTGCPQFITWRLVDALPEEVVTKLKDQLAEVDEDAYRQEYARRVEAYCDAGHGTCQLGNPAVAHVVQEQLFSGDGKFYTLHSWAVMANHVHVVLTPKNPVDLATVVKVVKGASARNVNLLLGRTGTLWQRDYFDKRIRDSAHFDRVARYVEWNPVKAGYRSDPAAFEWCSANGDSQKRLEFLRGLKSAEHAG